MFQRVPLSVRKMTVDPRRAFGHNTQLARMAVVHRLSYILSSFPFRGASGLTEYLAKQMLPPPSGPMLIETRYGFRIQIDPTRDKSIDEVVYYYGGYEVGTLSVLKLCLRRGDTFVDIGSNIGLMSLYGSKIVGETGKIYSLEANPSTFVALERNLKLNGTRTRQAEAMLR